MSKKTALIIYLFLSQLAIRIHAQEMYFTNINNYLQIPSLECYNVIQDSKGYIWICTENGLVKYSKDGKKVFDKSNGLDENGVYFIANNSNNEIDLLTANNRFLNIRNDKIVEHNRSKSIHNITNQTASPATFNLIYLLKRKPNGDIIINSSQRTYLVKKNTEEIIDLTKSNEYNSDAFLIIDKNYKEHFIIKNLTGYLSEIYDIYHTINIDVFADSKKKESVCSLMKIPDSIGELKFVI